MQVLILKIVLAWRATMLGCVSGIVLLLLGLVGVSQTAVGQSPGPAAITPPDSTHADSAPTDLKPTTKSPVDVVPAPLQDYLAKPDDSFRWELREELQLNGCEVLRLHLTSQTWHGIPWKHVLYVIKPSELKPERSDALLVIGGGRWQASWPDNGPDQVAVRNETQLMSAVANQFGCVIAVLSQVPFQPLLGDKYEDEIIAATFAKYMETEDTSWPLLLPMVKSAVRAMDATTASVAEQWNLQLDEFTVTGASKRGWTTWLTGASDTRATAIAPMVIDMLNMERQMQHQLDTWGKFSEQIADYTRLELPKYLATPRGQRLQAIVDPFAYREKLTQPKLLIFGTNDRYWPLDACNNYWQNLHGEKYLLYVPNQGHGISDYARVIGSIAALHRSQHSAERLPKLQWEFKERNAGIVLSIEDGMANTTSVDNVRGWVATSKSKDFRDAKWSQVPARGASATGRAGQWQIEFSKPDTGYLACFGEVVSATPSIPAFFSTNVQIYAGRPPQ